MRCWDCEDFDKEEMYCLADRFMKDIDISCALRMVIQELRISNFPEEPEKGEEWKFGGNIDQD